MTAIIIRVGSITALTHGSGVRFPGDDRVHWEDEHGQRILSVHITDEGFKINGDRRLIIHPRASNDIDIEICND